MEGRIGHDQVSGREINEMGEDVALGGAKKRGRDVVVEAGCQCGNAPRGVGQGLEDLRLALVAVGDQVGHPPGGIVDGLAMARQEALPVSGGEAVQRGHVGAHVAVGRRDDGGGPAHDVIAGKERVAEREAEMSAKMARGVDGGEAPVRAGERVAVGKVLVGGEGEVEPLAPVRQTAGEAGHQRTAAVQCPAEGHDRRAGGGGKARRQGGMVAVGMGDDDPVDSLAGAGCGEDGGEMRRIIGTGIDDGKTGAAHQPGVGAGSGQGRGIRGAQQPDRRIGAARPRATSQGNAGRIVWRAMSVFQRILPRGLYGRAALILIGPIVAIQLVFSSEFIQRFYEDVTGQMTQGVAIDLGFLLDRIEASPSLEAARDAVVPIAKALEINLLLPARPDAPTEDKRQFIDLSGDMIIVTLHERLPNLVAVDLTATDRLVHLTFDSRFGPVQAELSRRRMSATNPHQLMVLMVIASILLTIIAYFFLRRQLRPITKLAEVAEEFGKGRTVSYRPRGAIEVRAAGRAFLDMRARIERQIEQRTLMLSGVSHDLRTPLTRMRLALSLMPEDPEVEALQADVAQMERMVDEFLAFVRGDAMEGSAPTDVLAMVEDVVAHAGERARLVGVDGRPEPVEMRPQAVARALENLVSNALRFASRVELRVIFQERSLRITVEDDGPGIPADRREEALRPFTRLDASRDQNRGTGVGLGLSIASDVALSHGGSLRLSQSEALGGLRADLVIAR